MAKCLVHIELRDATPADLQRLTQEMQALGFQPTVEGNDGIRYRLPTGAHVIDTSASLDQVRRVADDVLTAVGKHGVVLVCEYSRLAWRLQPDWPTGKGASAG